MEHWWCYIGYKELFGHVYDRFPTPEENELFKHMKREEVNLWVLQHVGKTDGIFVAVDQREQNGYVAFTMLPYFVMGVWNKEIPVPTNGLTIENDPQNGTHHGTTIKHQNGGFKIVSWWKNGSPDEGETSIEIDQEGYVSNFRMKSVKFRCELIYNWQLKGWEPVNDQNVLSKVHISQVGQ